MDISKSYNLTLRLIDFFGSAFYSSVGLLSGYMVSKIVPDLAMAKQKGVMFALCFKTMQNVGACLVTTEFLEEWFPGKNAEGDEIAHTIIPRSMKSAIVTVISAAAATGATLFAEQYVPLNKKVLLVAFAITTASSMLVDAKTDYKPPS